MFPVSDVIPPRRRAYATIALVVVNSLVFLYELTLSRPELQSVVQNFGFEPAAYSWPTVVTSLFLHGSWVHVLGNMLFLWIFGDNVEDRLGHTGFLLFFMVCGVSASLTQTLMQPFSVIPLIGTSGAIAGVMGAYLILFPQSRVLTAVVIPFLIDIVEIPAIFFLGIWFLLQLLTSVGSLGATAADGPAQFSAHLAGFFVGALCGVVLRVIEGRRPRRWEC